MIPLNPLCTGTLIPKWDVDDLKQIFTEILIPTWGTFTSFPIHLWIGTLILNWDIDLFILFSYLDMIYHSTLNEDTSFYLGALGHSFHQPFIYYSYSVSHVSASVMVCGISSFILLLLPLLPHFEIGSYYIALTDLELAI